MKEPPSLGFFSDVLSKIRNKAGLFGLLAVIIITVTSITNQKLMLISLMLLTDALLKFQLLKSNIQMFGLEISTFTVLIAGATWGPTGGALTGLVASFTSALAVAAFGPFLLWRIPGFAFLGAAAGFLPPSSALIGFWLPVGMRAIFILFTFKLQPSGLADAFLYESTAAASVVVFWSEFSRPLLNLISSLN